MGVRSWERGAEVAVHARPQGRIWRWGGHPGTARLGPGPDGVESISQNGKEGGRWEGRPAAPRQDLDGLGGGGKPLPEAPCCRQGVEPSARPSPTGAGHAARAAFGSFQQGNHRGGGVVAAGHQRRGRDLGSLGVCCQQEPACSDTQREACFVLGGIWSWGCAVAVGGRAPGCGSLLAGQARVGQGRVAQGRAGQGCAGQGRVGLPCERDRGGEHEQEQSRCHAGNRDTALPVLLPTQPISVAARRRRTELLWCARRQQRHARLRGVRRGPGRSAGACPPPAWLLPGAQAPHAAA